MSTQTTPTRADKAKARAAEFDKLPDMALIDRAVVQEITGKCRATLYRWQKLGIIPEPRRLCGCNNVWTVGEIRRALRAGVAK